MAALLSPCTVPGKLISEGIVPDELKIKKIIPVHKSNANDDISIYRLTSLFISFSKIPGKYVYKRIFHLIQTNKILNNNQYGFPEKHSTINAITALSSDLDNVCIIMFTGVYVIIYPISLHLPMTYTFTKLDKPNTYVLLLFSYNCFYVKVQ